MTLAAGFHDIPVDVYHSDPAPEPSLSSSGIRTLLQATPAHFAARHPRLTEWPDLAEVSTKAQDLGTVIHSLVLGKGAAYRVIDLGSFRNKDGTPAKTWGNAEAKAAKGRAEAEGCVVLDRETHERACVIADVAIRALTNRYGVWPIGESEVAGLWQRKTAQGLIWCRELMDHFSRERGLILDVKTTGLPIAEEDLKRKIANEGGDIQDAWYVEGVEAICPELAGRVEFVRVFVEVEPPFAVRFVSIGESWRTRARFRINRAADLFAKCLRSSDWPAYTDIESLTPPSYLEAKWEAEELEEAV